MAATSAAAASLHSSPKLWELTSRIRPKTWCWVGTCAGCSHPFFAPKDTRRDHRYKRQYLTLAFSPFSGRRDSGSGREATQTERGASVGGKFRRDSAQGYRRCERQTGSGLPYLRQGFISAVR